MESIILSCLKRFDQLNIQIEVHYPYGYNLTDTGGLTSHTRHITDI